MNVLTTAQLLKLWEISLPLSVTRRSLQLLNAVFLGDDARSLSVGQCNKRLLQFRQSMFGNRLPSLTVCPACSQTVEWEQDVTDFQLKSSLENNGEKQLEVSLDHYTIHFRLPTTSDIEALDTVQSAGEKYNHLLKQCIIHAHKDGNDCSVNELPQKIIEQVELQMAEKDPLADVRILLTCPACSKEWETVFDIQSYLWKEINAWAKNIFKEVYTLAKYFGWAEAAILEMSHQRRQIYLKIALA